ncbi:hypothetical protein NIES4073_25940 [Kalymmatonema gypsitolerans NIES-4073]|uniref:hypothetical protein n=1 Tax=Scytonema sp. PRP1 TaxID=3120513 RepID=UPI000B5EEC2E|nr:hypothetical protein NIES4073_25940 [Scytonema sp. NIES-4073]
MSNSVLTATTTVKTLSLADWLVIADTLNYERLWAFDKFNQHSSSETYDLSALTLKDWEEIAELIGCDTYWANRRYRAHTVGSKSSR